MTSQHGLPREQVTTSSGGGFAGEPRAPRAPFLFALLGVAVAAVAVVPIAWHQLHVSTEIRLIDLDVYRSAGQSVLIGRPVYDYLTPPPQLLPFTYPPIAAVFALPLAALPWTLVQWLWTWSTVGLLVLVAAIAFRPALQRLDVAAPLGLGCFVAATAWLLPIRDVIRFGQVDVVLVALCLVDCVARRPRWPRGVLIGIATAVKLTPGVFIPYLWLTGRRQAAGLAAACTAGLTAFAAVVLPQDSRDYWAGALFDGARVGSNSGTSNQSLRGVVLRASLPVGVEVLLLVVLLTAVAVTGFRRARTLSASGDEVAAVAVVGLLAVLLSPVAWIHHLAWVALVLGVLVGDLRSRPRVFFAAMTGLVFALPLPWWGAHLMEGHNPVLVGPLLQNAYAVAAVLLVATLPARQLRRTVEPATQPTTAYAALAVR